ncbi:SMP-30/gluconolactonase/LRE family protein [Desmospora activa]|uniref:Sugar lactone lactonase YvrE n=1 Tax=Desmospora activa DSM 45169 TaxID=1121389 RepID=A0A2T4Z8V5_9BACL|nr:SMP-30/gluconolactonase/LRE family protein [Desmospora activa]PTM58319.1 sugar lactone lactonase YvrE [Desmospora activa DSM 45169]
MDSLQIVQNTKAELGEGPSWDAANNVLYWVDITRERLHIYHPYSNRQITYDTGDYISSVVPRRCGGVVMTLKKSFYAFDFHMNKMTHIGTVEQDKPHNRFNDGKCDALGRYWAGTMSQMFTPGAGALYCLEPDWRIKKVLGNITISNGIAWSPDNSVMYYIDSPTRKVMAYDYDLATATISNPRVAVTFPAAEPFPDGMATDEEGLIWVAIWKGGKITRWNPNTGELLKTIHVPATLTTSCVFGGDDLQDLYITSARIGLKEEILAKEPYAGGLFAIRTKVRGLPTYPFSG